MLKMLDREIKTDEEYFEKLRQDIKKDILVGMIGLAAVVGGIIYLFAEGSMNSSFLGGVFCGTGFAIILCTIKSLLKTRKQLGDDKFRREERLKFSDERNRFIGMRSLSFVGIITMGLCYLGMLVSGFFSMAVFWTFWGIIIVYSITTCILKKYLEKRL